MQRKLATNLLPCGERFTAVAKVKTKLKKLWVLLGLNGVIFSVYIAETRFRLNGDRGGVGGKCHFTKSLFALIWPVSWFILRFGHLSAHGCLVRDIILYLKSEWLARQSAGPCFMLLCRSGCRLFPSPLLISSISSFPIPFLHSSLRAVCLPASLTRPSHHNTISCDTPHIFSADRSYRAGAQEMRHYAFFKSFISLCGNLRVMKTIC